MIRILSLRSRDGVGTDKDVYRRVHRRTGMVTLVTFAYNSLSEIWERSEHDEPIALRSAA